VVYHIVLQPSYLVGWFVGKCYCLRLAYGAFFGNIRRVVNRQFLHGIAFVMTTVPG
jgi:hypothetical protein